MPIYEYEHVGRPCAYGKVFEVKQSIHEPALHQCPNCGETVRRIISRPNLGKTRSDTELRDLGFTKLVRRDNGVYENVTARNGESRIMHRDRIETYPDFKKTITD